MKQFSLIHGIIAAIFVLVGISLVFCVIVWRKIQNGCTDISGFEQLRTSVETLKNQSQQFTDKLTLTGNNVKNLKKQVQEKGPERENPENHTNSESNGKPTAGLGVKTEEVIRLSTFSSSVSQKVPQPGGSGKRGKASPSIQATGHISKISNAEVDSTQQLQAPLETVISDEEILPNEKTRGDGTIAEAEKLKKQREAAVENVKNAQKTFENLLWKQPAILGEIIGTLDKKKISPAMGPARLKALIMEKRPELDAAEAASAAAEEAAENALEALNKLVDEATAEENQLQRKQGPELDASVATDKAFETLRIKCEAAAEKLRKEQDAAKAAAEKAKIAAENAKAVAKKDEMELLLNMKLVIQAMRPARANELIMEKRPEFKEAEAALEAAREEALKAEKTLEDLNKLVDEAAAEAEMQNRHK